MKKRLLSMAMVCCIALGLCGCRAVVSGVAGAVASGIMEKEDVKLLVQGNLDEIYLDKTTPEYRDLVGETEEESHEFYMTGVEQEADFFAYYWCIYDEYLDETYEDVDPALQDKIVALLDEIYAHSKYEVLSLELQNDGDYMAEISIEPIDVMELASDLYDNDAYEPLNAFFAKYPDDAVEAMSDEEYHAYSTEYGELIVQMVEEQLPNLGYKEAITKVLRIETDEEGYLSFNDEDLMAIDEYIILYP